MKSFGRFAPSPSGDLHLGNLRTALLAWLSARSSGRGFVVRVEDLDRERSISAVADRQLADLAAIGLDWDGAVLHQSDRLAAYDHAIARLQALELTYECFCTRREIREASSAPQGKGEGGYPGTCRTLTSADRSRMRSDGRRPALRLRAGAGQIAIEDLLHPGARGSPDDVVLRRNDGLPAYNLAVVVDDAEQGVDQVVRGDDLLSSTWSQAHLADLLGLARVSYVHVPLALNLAGQRLAKRDGAVTLSDLAGVGERPADVLGRLAVSLGLAQEGELVSPAVLVARFDVHAIPRDPWIVG